MSGLVLVDASTVDAAASVPFPANARWPRGAMRRAAWVRALPAALALLLAACAGHPIRESPLLAATAAQQQAQAARVALLAAHPRWSLQGRVALSNGHEGGSGRIDWSQDGARYDVALSAPITRQSWRLSGDGAQATLEGLAGGTRRGSDPQALLHDATGWTIPVAALSSWVRGAADPEQSPARLQYGADGRLARLEQAGWTIDYADWQLEPAVGTELPGRLTAVRDDARVRLVVDTWQPGATGP
jgi:outer membrane lipoprotein LolB